MYTYYMYVCVFIQYILLPFIPYPISYPIPLYIVDPPVPFPSHNRVYLINLSLQTPILLPSPPTSY